MTLQAPAQALALVPSLATAAAAFRYVLPPAVPILANTRVTTTTTNGGAASVIPRQRDGADRWDVNCIARPAPLASVYDDSNVPIKASPPHVLLDLGAHHRRPSTSAQQGCPRCATCTPCSIPRATSAFNNSSATRLATCLPHHHESTAPMPHPRLDNASDVASDLELRLQQGHGCAAGAGAGAACLR
ncbi:hypothetical protein HYPSUDRAFT_209027 [Hypholoma sublateritium FD-334 SS-4]|uniref:Secreted protein n=1 Tax=Hypholoma sublateritium (strain FD-334 SS-4) TaxID=945553 RepID=A0A0D2LT84_HYPSF|nr:hypothetical protein HYPSUDRAFT_209027 [Hypholoma sublateritium FD-334 SS-4]